MAITFQLDDLPQSGSVVVFSRRPDETKPLAELQRFRLVRADKHTTKTGAPSAALYWRSDCTDCGTSYKFRSGLSTANFYRRCKKCRSGHRVGGWTHGPRIQHKLIPFISDGSELETEERDEVPRAALTGHKALDVASFRLWMEQARAAIPDSDDREATKQARRDWIDARLAEEAATPAAEDDIDPESLF